jgi:HSP20 family protein
MIFLPTVTTTRSLDRLLDDTFERLFRVAPLAQPNGEATTTPSLDVSESAQGWTVKLDMPGVAKEDVQINVEGRRVSVQAATQKTEEQKDGDRIVWRERTTARYARSFVLPVEVEHSDAQAKLENGVLTLVLPKRANKAASQITVS